MNILVTGSSGWLAQDLIPRLKRAGHTVIGLDPLPGPDTDIVGTVADRATVRKAIRSHRIQGIVHAGALHKPHVATHDATRFIETNVQGTLNLLQEATAPGSPVDRFVFTSTTSLMISQQIRDAHKRGVDQAFWIDEEMTPLEPRNIYGVSKLAAEHLCRMVHDHAPADRHPAHRPLLPEEDDMAHEIISRAQHQGQRVPVPPPHRAGRGSAHIVALDGAADRLRHLHHLGLDPFSPEDCEQLMEYAPLVVHRYFALPRDLRPPRLDDVRLHRPRLRFEQGDAAHGLRLPDRLRRHLTQLDREDGFS